MQVVLYIFGAFCIGMFIFTRFMKYFYSVAYKNKKREYEKERQYRKIKYMNAYNIPLDLHTDAIKIPCNEDLSKRRNRWRRNYSEFMPDGYLPNGLPNGGPRSLPKELYNSLFR